MGATVEVLTLTFFFCNLHVYPQSNDTRSVFSADSLAIYTIEQINRNELQSAEQTINAQLLADSSSLQWLFLRGMRYYADLFRIGSVNKSALASVEKDMENVTRLGEVRLEENPADTVALFYTGGAYGYLGLARAMGGSPFGGVRTAKNGFKMHEKLIGISPEYYDAYLGPGMMNLMTSDAPWILKPILWILGLSGSEDKAYEYLSTAYEKGKMVRLEAGTYLAQLYERRKDFNKSFEIYSTLIRRYPMRMGLIAESTTPLWSSKRYDDIIALTKSALDNFGSGRYLFTSGDSSWIPVIALGCSNAHQAKSDTAAAILFLEGFIHNDRFGAINKWRIHSSLADIYDRRKDTTNVVVHYKAILATEAPEDTKKRVREALEKLVSNESYK